MKRIRLATYNIHMGLSPFRRRDILDAIEVVLHGTKADILCLQEDLHVDDVRATHIAERCRKVWRNAAFGKTVVHPRGVQGNSIVSKFRILGSDIKPLPACNGQARSLIRARISLDRRHIVEVLCAHFGLSHRQRAAQAKATLEYVRNKCRDDCPLLIAGDFNDWRGRVSRYFNTHGGLTEVRSLSRKRRFLTFPALFPLLPLDAIYYRGCQLQAAGVFAQSGRLGHSDHLPLMADFDCPIRP